jgi:hypothetical protein
MEVSGRSGKKAKQPDEPRRRGARGYEKARGCPSARRRPSPSKSTKERVQRQQKGKQSYDRCSETSNRYSVHLHQAPLLPGLPDSQRHKGQGQPPVRIDESWT